MPKVNDWIKSIPNLLYPPTCLLCGEPSQTHLDLCPGCQYDLPRIEHACTRCGLPTPITSTYCGRCLNETPPFFRTRAPWRYTPPLSGLISALKFQGRLPCAKALGELLALEMQPVPKPDCLLPVPLHSERYRQRGFNQALEIARPLSRELAIPLLPGLCKRIRFTPPQRGLDAKQRHSNLRGAFEAGGEVEGLHVAVVDDVMTTGTTVREVAASLLKAGASRVEVWVVARA